jgi:hypothetical protein
MFDTWLEVAKGRKTDSGRLARCSNHHVGSVEHGVRTSYTGLEIR